ISNTMEKVENDYYFKGNSDVGFIIFSGAKADEKAYAYMAKLLNEAGHTVIIPKVMFHMSATGINHGFEIMESNPEIEKWFLIGHSLGGLPISSIADKEPDKLQGIAFLASYMITDLSRLDISAIRITASNDKIMNKKRMEEHLDYLPENSTSVVIDGANHQGFGAYDSLSRDGEATMSWKEQQERTVRLILDFFDPQINKGL
ncbi:alpha/beta hydrolase, partial [Streptomyces sp. NPDC057131]|uniref:alpha/beta hydrolase n=1 Tax=Streptomyces sp. NPDC057131 TaxID=3346027 RepID=UPI0036D3EE30